MYLTGPHPTLYESYSSWGMWILLVSPDYSATVLWLEMMKAEACSLIVCFFFLLAVMPVS
jgi:hypothetical protein